MTKEEKVVEWNQAKIDCLLFVWDASSIDTDTNTWNDQNDEKWTSEMISLLYSSHSSIFFSFE